MCSTSVFDSTPGRNYVKNSKTMLTDEPRFSDFLFLYILHILRNFRDDPSITTITTAILSEAPYKIFRRHILLNYYIFIEFERSSYELPILVSISWIDHSAININDLGVSRVFLRFFYSSPNTTIWYRQFFYKLMTLSKISSDLGYHFGFYRKYLWLV